MTDLTGLQLASVALNATAAVVWGSVALREWETCRVLRPQNPLFALLRNLTALGAIHFAAEAVVCLVPSELLAAPPAWLVAVLVIGDCSLVAVAPVAWHLTRYWGARVERPSWRGIALAYGSAALVMALTLTFPIVFRGFTDPLRAYIVLRNMYLIVLFGLAVRRMVRVVRRGRWRPGAAANAIVRADIWLFAGSLVVMAMVLAALVLGGIPTRSSLRGFAIDALITGLVTIPIAVRELVYVVRGLLFVGGLVAAATAAFFGHRALVASFAGHGVPRFLDASAIIVLVAVLLPAQAGLRHAIRRLVLQRRAHLWNDLRAFLATLSPDAGATEICERALAEVVRVLGLRGAAVVLRDGETIVEGEFDVEPLRGNWPRGEALDRLPPALVTLDYLDELPPAVIDALMDAEVVGVVPITSPRRRWGALFATSGLLEPTPEEGDAVEAFVGHLAVLLDAAALLERTVAVERALAHAEKLAAIGELAARIAHEIRNPVTAARSLAQLLAREPTAPANAEHAALILGELERVEAQVRALLRFSRREEYRFEPVDLVALVRATLGPLRPRLDQAEVAVVEDVAAAVVVRGDPEKLRQVVANLVDNAIDALATTPASDRRLRVCVGTANGTATLRVTDSGPGVPDEALPRLFEPFFSLKPNGTGLGLAIARRTVEAHGGRIVAERAQAGGTSFRVDLPARA